MSKPGYFYAPSGACLFGAKHDGQDLSRSLVNPNKPHRFAHRMSHILDRLFVNGLVQ